jgi:hypothetical protein
LLLLLLLLCGAARFRAAPLCALQPLDDIIGLQQSKMSSAYEHSSQPFNRLTPSATAQLTICAFVLLFQPSGPLTTTANRMCR